LSKLGAKRGGKFITIWREIYGTRGRKLARRKEIRKENYLHNWKIKNTQRERKENPRRTFNGINTDGRRVKTLLWFLEKFTENKYRLFETIYRI